ncbi:MAG: hypothetical protein HY000_30955 [Planctomycetes bacterium]|nr:hypothetical protein [Planctomycetota bacterium]
MCLLIGLACFAGCGTSDRAEISGKVTLNGTPIEDGDISFFPEPGSAAAQSSAPIKDGEYRISEEWGLVAGSYQVRINAYRPSTDKSNMLAGGFLDKPPTTPGIPNREQFLPKKFNAESTLEKLVVPPGETTIEQNYDLKQ